MEATGREVTGRRSAKCAPRVWPRRERRREVRESPSHGLLGRCATVFCGSPSAHPHLLTPRVGATAKAKRVALGQLQRRSRASPPRARRERTSHKERAQFLFECVATRLHGVLTVFGVSCFVCRCSDRHAISLAGLEKRSDDGFFFFYRVPCLLNDVVLDFASTLCFPQLIRDSTGVDVRRKRRGKRVAVARGALAPGRQPTKATASFTPTLVPCHQTRLLFFLKR